MALEGIGDNGEERNGKPGPRFTGKAWGGKGGTGEKGTL